MGEVHELEVDRQSKPRSGDADQSESCQQTARFEKAMQLSARDVEHEFEEERRLARRNDLPNAIEIVRRASESLRDSENLVKEYQAKLKVLSEHAAHELRAAEQRAQAADERAQAARARAETAEQRLRAAEEQLSHIIDVIGDSFGAVSPAGEDRPSSRLQHVA